MRGCRRGFETGRGTGRSLALGLAVLLTANPLCAVQWNPPAFANADTVSLRTICAGEGEYWFPVWLVVIEDQVYVRLGSRAAQRVGCNQTAPHLAVEIAGQRFDRVRAEPVPDEAERVAEAMADKYPSDLFIRWLPHPLTLRLVPEQGATPPNTPQ